MSGDAGILIFYLVLAIGVSFVCSVLEAVLLSVRRVYIEQLKEEGSKAGAIWERLRGDMGRPISAILILNTAAHTVGAAGVGAQAQKVFASLPVGVISGILTLLILVISEIIPKTLGATYWRALAPVCGRIIDWLTRLLGPLVWAAERITSLFGEGHGPLPPSREEVATMMDIGQREGTLDLAESRIVKNLFALREMRVRDIMTPRTVVFSLPEETTVHDYVTEHARSPFSRIPIYAGDPENVTGFVLRSDILFDEASGKSSSPLSRRSRSLGAVPDTMPIWTLFEDLISRRHHIRLVHDEYGGITGVVTLEDVVETLIGLEIVDEADADVDLRAAARALWAKRTGNAKISDPGGEG
ncbi:MAG: hemolysin family protein [Verrucomicrobiales bacterium]